MWGGKGISAQVELENAGNHDDQVAPVPVLEQRKLEGLGTTDEEAAAQAVLALDNPVAAAGLPDQKERRLRAARRECFSLAQCTSSLSSLAGIAGDDRPTVARHVRDAAAAAM